MHRDPRDLPPDLALPLATGEPWWYWLGGRPSVDLVNTLRERWNRRVETLVTRDDLADWLLATGVAQERLRIAPEVLGEARALREAIDLLLTDALGETPAPEAARAEAVHLVDHWLVHAGERPRLAVAGDGTLVLGERPAADSARRALGTIALDAATMLGTPKERARIRICANATCSARFYDRSPAGARRWCSMKTCGNEAKARRHRARRRGEDPA